MINGLEGIPGSGKSYEAVGFHVLPALQSKRKVITNLPLNVEAFAAIDPEYRDLIEIRTTAALIRGKWDAADIAKSPAFQLWPDGKTQRPAESVFTFGGVWDYYSEWKDDSGRGPLYVVDECHVALPKGSTPDAVIQWFKLHRHFNADVLLITQSFRDINQPIAQLIATLIKCRKADVLGKADHYIRKVHAGYRGALIQTDQRPYKPQFFSLYKSHTQGASVAESDAQDVSPMIVKFNRVKWAVVLCGLVAMAWAFWPKPDTNVFGVKKVTAKRPAPAAPAPAVPASGVVLAAHAEASATAPEKPEVKEPFDGKGLHIVGDIQAGKRRVIAYAVSVAGLRSFTVTSEDLRSAGYKVEHLAPCVGWLEYGGVRRAVTCDAPQMTPGRSDAPIVSYNGARSDQPIGGARTHAYVDQGRYQITAADIAAASIARTGNNRFAPTGAAP